MTIPMNPNKFPKKNSDTSTQKPGSPVESPSILGPRILPSNCCKITMKIRSIMAFLGSINSISAVDGIAPIIGPKNGIILVTPTRTLIMML